MTPPTIETTNGSKGQIVRRGFHLIWRSLKAEPLNHSIALAGAIVYALSLVGFTRALSWATDTVIIPTLGGSQPSNFRLFTTVAVVMGVAFLRGVGAAFRRHFLAIAEYRTEEGWRHNLFDHYLDQPLSTLRRHPVGRLIAHIDSDVNTAGMVLKPLAFAAATVVLAVVGMASLFEIHPWFGFLGLVLFPSLAVINQRFSNAVEHPAADVQRAVGDVTSVAHESFDGAMMVKTLGRQSQEVARFQTQSESLKSQRLIVGRINTTYQPLLRILPNIGALAMLTCGATLIDQEAITFGELIGAVTLLSVLAVPLRVFAFFLQSMPPSVVALDRIDAFLNEDDRKSHRPQQSIVGGNKYALLNFDDVAFYYPALSPTGRVKNNNIILDQLTMTLKKGEVVALVGSTGSGKTTIAELAAGLISPSAGSIRRQPGATIALALQESFLFDASISANLTLGATHDRDEIVNAAAIAQATRFISELPDQYETVIGERGVTLSGGQRQRLALARALLRKPDLLVLDDATSAIDPVIEASILRALRKQDLTMLMIANRISTIRLADRVLFLNNQRIEASGSHRELLELPAYRTLLSAELKPLGGTA